MTLKVVLGHATVIAWLRYLAGTSDPLWHPYWTEHSSSDVEVEDKINSEDTVIEKKSEISY